MYSNNNKIIIMIKKIKINLDGDRRESVKNGGGEIFIFYFFLLSLLSLIYGVSIVGIRRAKNKSSSTRRGLHVSTKNTGFRREFK